MPTSFKPLACLFCSAPLDELYEQAGLDIIHGCPRCGAAVTFTTDLSDVRPMLAEAVFGVRYASDEQLRSMRMLVEYGIDTLTEDGEVLDEVHLAVAWDPEEQLDSEQVAAIFGWSDKRQVATAIGRDWFPGATKEGHEWRVPRADVGGATVMAAGTKQKRRSIHHERTDR